MSILTVPIFEPAGQATGLVVWMPICSGVHASSPCAAEGLSVIPSGSVTTAVFSCAESISFEFGACGTSSSVVMPSGRSDWLVCGFSRNAGSNATSPHFSEPIGVVYAAPAISPFCEVRWIVVVVCGPTPVHAVGMVMKPPLPGIPAVPLKVSRDLIRGSDGETLISK